MQNYAVWYFVDVMGMKKNLYIPGHPGKWLELRDIPGTPSLW